MSWTCPSCGVDNALSAATCAICMRPQKVITVVLTSAATGLARVVRIPTVFGVGCSPSSPGTTPASPRSRSSICSATRPVRVGWSGTTRTRATPTFYDGAAVGPIPVPIGDGGTLSIGPTRLRLIVRLESSTETSRS